MGLNFVAMAEEIEELFGVKTDVVPKRFIKREYLHNIEKDIVYVWKKTFDAYRGYSEKH